MTRKRTGKIVQINFSCLAGCQNHTQVWSNIAIEGLFSTFQVTHEMFVVYSVCMCVLWWSLIARCLSESFSHSNLGTSEWGQKLAGDSWTLDTSVSTDGWHSDCETSHSWQSDWWEVQVFMMTCFPVWEPPPHIVIFLGSSVASFYLGGLMAESRVATSNVVK